MSNRCNLPQGPFGCILADPPWSFKTWSGKTGTPHRTANDHYSTTETRILRDIPVADVAAKDCALFMWVVDSHIPDAIELGRAWGFEMKTRAFTWRKITRGGQARIGMGYWTRKQTELCFLFTRGKVKRKDKGVREIIDAPRREHSRKPDEQYERIERLVDGPYLELFARQAWPNWRAWGDQTDKFGAANDDLQLFSEVAA
jgi:N6-adenosine-specific RNA methylase IME4